jgi:hypothetical protein
MVKDELGRWIVGGRDVVAADQTRGGNREDRESEDGQSCEA